MNDIESGEQTPEDASQTGTKTPEEQQAYLDGLLAGDNIGDKPEGKPFVQDPRVLRALAHAESSTAPREMISDVNEFRPEKSTPKAYLEEDRNTMANASRAASRNR